MNLTLPRELNPGQPARAESVNANFNAVLEYLETFKEGSLNKDFSNLTEESLATLKSYFSIRNIGEIIFSPIPLTDSCFHLADGSLLSGEGTYSEFVNHIKKLYNSNSEANFFTSEQEWQNSVVSYGECGKFVYDSELNTVRLPKITGILEGTTDLTVLGDLIEAGLPNHSHTYVTYADTTGRYQATGADGLHATRTLNTSNASDSNSIYGNSNTVQPQTIKYFVYICISTSAKLDIQSNIDNITTDLNGKADTDLTNCTKPHITETYRNNGSWYRLWSDGFIEQGGYISGQQDSVNQTINYLKPLTTIVLEYNVHNTRGSGQDPYAFQLGALSDPGLTSMVIRTVCNTTTNYIWSVRGY
ncbi:hypothetical protein J6G99_04905 [bacterium]|nr:hypothetical protein [bacterium]